MKAPTGKYLTREPSPDMVEVAYPMVESLPTGTPERDRHFVSELWRAMWDMADKTPQREPGLPKMQKRLHDFIADFVATHGVSPTYDEAAEALGYSQRGAIAQAIDGLCAKGILDKDHKAFGRKLIVKKWPGTFTREECNAAMKKAREARKRRAKK